MQRQLARHESELNAQLTESWPRGRSQTGAAETTPTTQKKSNEEENETQSRRQSR